MISRQKNDVDNMGQVAYILAVGRVIESSFEAGYEIGYI